MKKLVCLVVALMLCLTAITAFAAPSKTQADLVNAVTDVAGASIVCVAEDPDAKYVERIESCVKEAEKMAECGSIDEYFGEELATAMKAYLETESLTVAELYPVIATGFEAGFGATTCTLTFPTVFDGDAKVCVLIGMVTVVDDAQVVEWTAVEATASENVVTVELTEEIVMAMQEGEALLAVVCGNVEA